MAHFNNPNSNIPRPILFYYIILCYTLISIRGQAGAGAGVVAMLANLIIGAIINFFH